MTGSRKNEVPEIEDDASEGCDILQTLRYDIDRYYASRKPIELTEYGSLCNLIHQADEKFSLISSKAQDHRCADGKPHHDGPPTLTLLPGGAS